MDEKVVIVGSGHGGAHAAVTLRQRGFAGAITLFGSEPDLPYERPPLSKDFLLGERDFDRILLRPATFWGERGIDLRTGHRIASVDAVDQTVADADGERTSYDHLIWATGGTPRRLTCDGHDLAGVHYLRDRRDAERLMAKLPAARRAVVIGGGYIGLEAAAVLRKKGIEVVLVEALDRVLARVAGAALSRFYEAEHRARGVDIRLSAAVGCLEGDARDVTAVRLADGERVPADIVVVGIGIEAAVAPLLAAGATGDNGVAVDARCRTSLSHVFAIGDCAIQRSRYADGAALRIESVQNANDMAVAAVREIMGEGGDYDAVPWFWSNQYDLKLQTVGLSTGHDATVLRGDPATRSFSVVYLRRGAVVALDCVNAVRDYAQGKALVAAGAIVDPARLADAGVALRDLAA